MWRTSARGRIQFSVEKPNTVSQPMSRVDGEPHDAGQVLLALGVAGGARQSAAPGPAPVAVHDAGDVQCASACFRGHRSSTLAIACGEPVDA